MVIRSSVQKAARAKKPAGRPRDPDKERQVLDAALQLLKQDGFEKFSMAKVAAKSGVARPTIRLRWANKEELCIATVQKLFDDRPPESELEKLAKGDIKEMIRLVMADLILMISEPGVEKVLSSLIAAANYSEPLSQLRQYILNRRGITLRGLMQRGVETGQFPENLDIERALDALNGPIIYRMLVVNLPMDARDADYIVDMVFPQTGT